MKTVFKTLTAGALVITLATACTNSNSKKPKEDASKPAPSEPVKISALSDAEQLTAAGEQLISPYTFMLANKVFDIALTGEPKNQKALFYKNMLKPLMAFKGLYTRVKPFARKHGDIKSLEKSLSMIPQSPLRDFLTDGKEDIATYEDIQTWLVSLRNGFNEFRVFLRDNPNLDIVINLNPHVMQVGDTSFAKSCRVVTTSQITTPAEGVYISVGSNNYQVVDGQTVSNDYGQTYQVKCDYSTYLQRKLNPADTLVMRQALGAYVILFGVYTWYNVSGIETYIANHKDKKFPSAGAAQLELESLPEFAKLRKDNNMKEVLSIGADLVPAARVAIGQQQQWCPNGVETPDQREGHIFSNGICINNVPETERAVGLLERALKGFVSTEVDIPGTNQKATTNVDFFAWFRNPVQDLRTVAPASYNGCDQAERLRDRTAGGIYPNGDAETFILGRTECNDL